MHMKHELFTTPGTEHVIPTGQVAAEGTVPYSTA